MLLAAALAWSWSQQPPRDARAPAPPASTGDAAGVRTDPGRTAADAPPAARAAAVASAPALCLRVLVVNAGGMPAAGALVRYYPPRSDAERERDHELQERLGVLEAALRANGRSATTDAHGLVELLADDCGWLCARHGDSYGEADGVDDDVVPAFARIELVRDVALTVEVVDAEGRPCAGMLVDAEARSASRRHGTNRVDETIGPTDADGRIVVPHAASCFSWHDDVGDGELVLRCTRSANCTEYVLAEARIRVTEVTAAPVRLVVPAGGMVVVRAVDEHGEPDEVGATLYDDRDEVFDWGVAGVGGRRFLQVPLGKRWVVRVDHRDDVPPVAVDGPTRSDQTIDVVVQLPPCTWRMLTAAVRRRDGVELRHAEVTVTTPRTTWTERVGDDGRMSLFLSGPPGDPVAPLTVRFAHHAARPRTVTLSDPGEGETDLGEILLEPPADEVELARCVVRCDGEVVTARAWAVLQAEGDTVVNTLKRVVRRRDGDAFVFLGAPTSRRLVLSCTHGDCLWPGWLPIARGETKVVELERAASLAVRCEPPDVPPDLLCAELVDGRNEVHEQRCRATGHFVFDQVAPGPCALRIRAGDRVVHSQRGIVLRPGRTTWPQAGALDLRGRARALRVATFDREDRGAAQDAWFLAVAAGATELPEDARNREDWWVPLPEPMDLLIAAHGFVPTRVHDPRTDVRVELVRRTPVEFLADEGGPDRATVRVAVDPQRDALLRAFWPCEDPVELQREPGERSFGEPRAYDPGTVIEVTPSRAGSASAPRRVVVGTLPLQQVELR